MREKYWDMWMETHYNMRYFLYYRNHTNYLNSVIIVICCVAVAISVVNWGVFETIPILWSIIIASSQLMLVIKPRFTISKRLIVFRFLLPELYKLVTMIELDWNKIQVYDYNDKKIEKLLNKHQKTYLELVNRYEDFTTFPFIENCSGASSGETACIVALNRLPNCVSLPDLSK